MILLAGIVVVALLVFLFRSDPIGPLAGKALTGELMNAPATWPTCEKDETLAIEVRPDDPHSVNIWYFILNSSLFVGAFNPKEKEWAMLIDANPKVKVKICDQLFKANAHSVVGYSKEVLVGALTDKYPTFQGKDLKKELMAAGPDSYAVFEVRR